jgi:hypothetical protein
MITRNFVLFTLIGLLLVRCQPQEPLPAPAVPCPIQVGWRGFQPGASTILNTIQTLGLPGGIHILKYPGKQIIDFAYHNGEGYLNDIMETKILFGQGGVVDWIEIPATQSDINFHSVKEITDKIGSPDIIYPNNNFNPAYKMFDILSGPGQVYVWTGCGLAVIGLDGCIVNQDQMLKCLSKDEINQTPDDLIRPIFSHPMNSSGESWTSVSAIFLEIHFIPTTYEGFNESYQFQFSFLNWDFWDKVKGYSRK